MSNPESAIFFMGAARKRPSHGHVVASGAQSVSAFQWQAGKTPSRFCAGLSQVRLKYLADMFGTDRLLVGSDYPAMGREQPIAKTLRSMGLSEAELDDVLWKNAFRFLGIDPPK